MKLNAKLIVPLAIVAILVGGVLFSFSIGSYAGGWNINNTPYDLILDDESYGAVTSKDLDGDVISWGKQDNANYSKPGLTVEMSQVHYEESVMGSWQYSSTPVLLDHYTVSLNSDGTKVQIYWLYMVGFEVTIKTSADKFLMQRPVGDLISDYGWNFEYGVVDVRVLTTLALSQWTPMGEDGNWTIVGGWSGVLSASCLAEEHGLVEDEAEENYGHVIQNLNSVNSRLNMYVDDAISGTWDFDNTGSLRGVPSVVQVETYATLGAGAHYTSDSWSKWASCSVRNVFVKYTVGCEVLTTLQYALKTSHVGPLVNPDEANTDYAPLLPNWLQALVGAFSNPFAWVLTVVIVAIVGFVIIKVFGHRR